MRPMLVFDSPIGKIGLSASNAGITRLWFGYQIAGVECAPVKNPLLVRAANQLREYFFQGREQFDLPLDYSGTAFQKKVWNALRGVPYGKTTSYSELAQAVENPKACRAVGLANNRNPLPVLIPCHRVIGADGSLTGYRGGLEIKTFLLDLERKKF